MPGPRPDPRRIARLAGVLYGISAVPAGFSVWAYVKLVVRGDAAATAAHILGSEGLFRLGFAAEVTGIVLFVASVLLLFELFTPVSRRLALLLVSFGLIGAGIQALDSLADLAALFLLKRGGGLTAFTIPQTQALALASLRLHMLVYDVALVFFGVMDLVIGALVARARFLPRVFGALMAISGLGYLVSAFAVLLAPPFAVRLQPFVPYATAFLGEGLFMLWLIVKTVDARRWEEQAMGAAPA